MPVCGGCRRNKPASEFHVQTSRNGKPNLRSPCKSCLHGRRKRKPKAGNGPEAAAGAE